MTSKAQRQQATDEMIAVINRRADEARVFREKEALRRAAIEEKEAADRRDDEITKLALTFSMGMMLATVGLSAGMWLMNIHPLQHAVM